MSNILGYFVLVVVYFYITFHIFPLDVYHSILNTLIGFFCPVILGMIFGMLEKIGIIKSNSPQESFTTNAKKPKSTENLSSLTTEDRSFDESCDCQEDYSESPPAIDSVPPAPRQPTIDEMLHSVDLLTGVGFERWCAYLLRIVGFSDVKITKESGDQGVDIIALKDDVRYAIQCKCYSSNLGNHPIQEVHAGKSMYNCHVGVVMTNCYFTSGAKELAKATGTLLWDRNKLKTMLQEVKDKCE